MSETKNLRLFKHNEPLETNENKFDIDLALNQNWDKIEEFADMVNDKVIELEDKDEEQDFNLQELQNEIKKDRENMINLETEGQSIHIEDSSDLEGKLEVLGNMEQDVREGYNILENTLTDKTANGITVKVNKDKSITLNGTAEINMSIEISNKPISLENVDYTYYLKGKTANFNLFVTKENDETQEILTKTDTNIKKIVNLGAVTIKNVKAYFQKGATANNVTIYPMIYKGTEEKYYEQYGASPSPEYPSEIRAVGDNINFFNKEQVLQGSANSKSVQNRNSIFLKKVKKGEKYTSQVFNSNLNYAIAITDTNTQTDTIKISQDSGWQSGNYTITCNADGYLYMGIRKKDNANINPSEIKATDFKVEQGDVATSYSEFGQGSVEIQKTTANYYDLQAGISNPANEDGWITLKGTNTGTSITYLNYFTTNLDLVIGKKYWIVAEIKSVSGEGNFNITSRMYNQGQFNTHGVSLTNLKSGDLVIYSEVALNTQGVEQGLRTFISLPAGESVNITFRISVLETEPNKSNWKYVPYKKETKILPIQKPMLIRDCFDKLNNKEVHTWKKIVLDGVNNKVTQTTTNQSGKYRYIYTDKDLQDCSLSEEKAYCTHLPLIEKSKTYDKILGFTVANNSIYIYTDGDTASNFNAKLQKENYIFYIPVIESAYEKIDLTPEQTKVLDELNNFQTYKPVTNITTDSIAKIKLKYIADTKTYVDNKVGNLEQQLNTINQLLSTTKTSSVLLDNLQTDIEREVL